MAEATSGAAASRASLAGLFILCLVNVLWVVAGEITRYIFVDLKFERPFLLTYIKLCMLTAYMFRYFLSEDDVETVKANGYTKVKNEASSEGGDVESLTPAEFERVLVSEESDAEYAPKVTRQVRFAEVREVRHMPLSMAEEALRARLPYSAADFWCYCAFPRQLRHALFLAPMWIVCTLTYQASLMFISVSSLNLVSSSSSLFVLILSSVCSFSPSDRFSWLKLLLVVCNFAGVALVSEYSVSSFGTSLGLFSAFCYAIYLTYFSYSQSDGSLLDMNLMMGMVGVLTLLLYTPLLFLLHYLSVEPLLPLPDRQQLIMLILNGVVGTLFSDFLWLLAAGLTSPLAASISLSMCIPLSFLADFLFRSQTPSMVKLIAAVPITVSFLGAALLRSNAELKSKVAMKDSGDSEEGTSLINESDVDEEDQL